jgi:hypothetical protein
MPEQEIQEICMRNLLRLTPADTDETVYLVADDFGQIGRAWREADYDATDLETVIHDLLSGEYSNPIRVVAFNTPSAGPKMFRIWLRAVPQHHRGSDEEDDRQRIDPCHSRRM